MNREFLELYSRLDVCLDTVSSDKNVEKISIPSVVEGNGRVGRTWYAITGSMAVGEVVVGPNTLWNRGLILSKVRRIVILEQVRDSLYSISASVHPEEPRISVERKLVSERSIKDHILDVEPFYYRQPFYEASTFQSRRPLEAPLVRLEAAILNR